MPLRVVPLIAFCAFALIVNLVLLVVVSSSKGNGESTDTETVEEGVSCFEGWIQADRSCVSPDGVYQIYDRRPTILYRWTQSGWYPYITFQAPITEILLEEMRGQSLN